MRTAFLKAMLELAQADPKLFLLTGDMGFSVFEPFEAAYPGRFLNLGIAEANMAGVAAGLAMSGMNVFMYSIVPFATMRCFEQIRVDICYQDLPVTVVGVGGGLSYGPAGGSHQSVEDVSIMRSLPGMSVAVPGDPREATLLTHLAAEHRGPLYLRLGKNGERPVNPDLARLPFGRAIRLREGRDVTILVSGALLENAVIASDLLEQEGFSVRLSSVPFVKPVDRAEVEAAARETKLLVTLEEHSLIGGLGSAVSEVVAELGLGVRVERVALPDAFVKEIGSQEYLRAALGLAPEQIRDRIRRALEAPRP